MVNGTPITFGKYKGVSWEFLVNTDPAYIVWYDKTIRDPKYRNCPEAAVKAAYRVCAKRSYMDPYWGTRPDWDWDHPDFIGYQ